MRIMDKRLLNRFGATVNVGASTLTDEYKDIVDVFKRIQISENYQDAFTFEFDSDKQIQELIDMLQELKENKE